MTYYETPEDRDKEIRALNKAITLFPLLQQYDFKQRKEDVTGVIFDHFGKNNNPNLLDIFVDVKLLYTKTNYPTNIISVSKYNMAANNPDYDFYMLYYYVNFRKFRLRKIVKDECEFIPNFKCLHKRATALNGVPTYDNSPVYFLKSQMKEVSI